MNWPKLPKLPKPKRNVPRSQGMIIILILIIFTFSLIVWVWVDEYTLGALLIREQTYWQRSPNISRAELVAMWIFSLLAFGGIYKLLPLIKFVGASEKLQERKLTTRWRWPIKYEGNKATIKFLNGKKEYVHKGRLWRDGNNIIVFGLYDPKKGRLDYGAYEDGDTIIIEDPVTRELQQDERLKEDVGYWMGRATRAELLNVTKDYRDIGYGKERIIEKLIETEESIGGGEHPD